MNYCIFSYLWKCCMSSTYNENNFVRGCCSTILTKAGNKGDLAVIDLIRIMEH